MRCETLSDKDAWLEVLNRTASMQREREEKEQRSRNRESANSDNGWNSSSANQRNATTSENSEKRPVYDSTTITENFKEGHAYGSEESKDWREIEESRDILRERMASDINGISSAADRVAFDYYGRRIGREHV